VGVDCDGSGDTGQLWPHQRRIPTRLLNCQSDDREATALGCVAKLHGAVHSLLGKISTNVATGLTENFFNDARGFENCQEN
jgi:hypothetical protein